MKLIRTAFVPPRKAVGVVRRARLSRYLDMTSQTRLVVIHAPAGCGKTTLMSQWCDELSERDELAVWLSLDRHAQNVLLYFAAALGTVLPGIEAQIAPSDEAEREFRTSDEELALIVNGLAGLGREVFIFVDDAQFLPDGERALFRRFVEALPNNVHLVLAGRQLPDLPLARLRAQGDLLTLGIEVLRFTRDETARLLSACNQDGLNDEQLGDLVTQTEGWATGLRLATMSMAIQADRATLLAPFSGTKSVVADFFSEDVLSSQPNDLRSFLMTICHLERFCAELCDEVTGRTDSQAMLERVEAAGLFLIRLDDEATWFRFHGLFGDFLCRRSAGLEPQLAHGVHMRAAKWLLERDLVPEAMDHARRAQDDVLLADLLEQTCDRLVYDGKLLYVCELANHLRPEVLQRCPRIMLNVAWLHLRAMEFDQAQALIDKADAMRGEAELPLGDRQDPLNLVIAHRRMMLAASQDRFEEVEARNSKLLERVNDINPYLACNIYGQSIRAQRDRFRFDQFDRFEALARRTLNISGYKFAYVAQQAIVGKTYFLLARHDLAQRALDFGLKQAIDFAGEGAPLAALPALPMAELAYDQNDLERSQALLDISMPVARRFSFGDELMSGLVLAPRLRMATGDLDAALQALDDAHSIAAEIGTPRLLEGVRAERVKILLSVGRVEKALSYDLPAGVDMADHKPSPQSSIVDEMRAATRVRLGMARGLAAGALQLTQRWKQFLHMRGAQRGFAEWSLLHAQALLIDGDRRAAQRSLREALSTMADSRGVRLFLDEGLRIHELLAEAYGSGLRTSQAVDRFAYELLDLFETGRKGGRAMDVADVAEEDELDPVVDGKMTGRELEILAFVASGLRNREIGDRLGLTEGSVKWYMQRIYDKVGTRRRSVAVERARQFGFLQ